MQVPPGSRKRRLMRRWWFWLALVLVVGLAWYGCRWLWGPREFRLVGRYPVQIGQNHNDEAWLTPAGMVDSRCLPTGARQWHQVLTLQGWDGKIRWQVALPPVPEPGTWYEVALSPDTRTLVAHRHLTQSCRVLCWRDGKLRSDVQLSNRMMPEMHFDLNVMPADDGRVWCYQSRGAVATIIVIDGQKVTVGSHTARVGVAQLGYRMLSPDGTTLVCASTVRGIRTVCEWEYCTLSVRGDKIAVRHRYLVPNTSDQVSTPLMRGFVLTGGGAIFGESGCTHIADKWQSVWSDRLQRQLPQVVLPPMALLQYERNSPDAPKAKPQLYHNYARFRIINPQSGFTWYLPTWQGMPERAQISDDGRRVLLAEWTPRKNIPKPLAGLVSRLPFMQKALDSYSERRRLSLFEYPGKRRACLDFTFNWIGNQSTLVGRRTLRGHYKIQGWQFSADGKYIGLDVESTTRGREYLVFRW